MIVFALLPFLLPALVSAHGFVSKVAIDGKTYNGDSVGTGGGPSAIRQVNTNSPVKGASNPDLSCGPGAPPAADVADANPGSEVDVYWVSGTVAGAANWVHNVGPVMHYMASCNGPCTSFDAAGAKWFKISEDGENGSTWYQAQLQTGAPAKVTIPSTLAAGNYLLRSEIIALQNAASQGGAEFYPSCVQLAVGGSQTGQPSPSEEVTFPGAYSDTDPGILVNVYGSSAPYTFPGPPVAQIAGGSSSGGSGAPSASAPSSSSGASPSASSAPIPSPSAPANGGAQQAPPAAAPAPSSSTAPYASPAPMSGGAPPAAAPAPSSSTTPPVPVNAAANPSSSSAAATPTVAGGTGSTCKPYKRSAPQAVNPPSNFSRRMHRRRQGASH